VEQKKRILIWIGCTLLFALALVLSFRLSEEENSVEGADHGQIVICEAMADNRTYPSPDGNPRDYVEVCNISDIAVDLSGYLLTDKVDEAGYLFPVDTVLQPGDYMVCWCDKYAAGSGYAAFGISTEGTDTLYLYNAANVLVDQKQIPALQSNRPVSMVDGNWVQTDYGTPGFPNDAEGYRVWLQSVGQPELQVVISEVMTDNRSSAADADGNFADWIELHNMGTETAVLQGCYLSDDSLEPLLWQLPELTLQVDERAIVHLTQAPFALSSAGTQVLLTGAYGQLLDQVTVPQLQENRSWSRLQAGSFESGFATPGFENTQEGREAWLRSHQPRGELAITEVMPSNDRYLRQSDGKYYDWLEVKNISEQEVELSSYYLSDDSDSLRWFQLPQGTLAPGERITVICSGGVPLRGDIQAPFTLSREECSVYLTGPEGLCDWLHIYDVPYQASAGRREEDGAICYFSQATPGKANGEGSLFLSAAPQVLTPEGVYEDVSQVEVILSGSRIHYTMDGSLPTAASPVYTQPITLTSTAVIRAACFEDGKLPGDTVTASYIINEGHTLPVLGLAAEPDELFGSGGIYINYKTEAEIPCNLKLFEESGSFSIDCGLKMHGHTGLEYPKKSFKVNFRGRYGDDVLSYPVYGEDGPQIYDSLCVRAGQDYPSSIFRDELFAALCRQMGENVLTQRDKFCILYINGQYFGIYCLKEAFSQTYYAQNRGVSEQSVTIAQAPVDGSTDFLQLLQYCQNHDLAVQEHYDYVAARVDVDSFIDWMIIEGYSCNGDIQQNLRYFKSSEDGGRWQPALYDLDWAFYFHDPMYHVLSIGQDWQHMPLTRGLMRNAGFREKFLQRLSWAMENVLSHENVIAVIDSYQAMLDAEVPRERARWEGNYASWLNRVDSLRNFLQSPDHLKRTVDNLRIFIGLTQEEEQKYFGRWS